ncbi:hypothetical protein PVK06_045541 [Gossypium arboreum]|uniref:Uncharacterized protein n=1 Tax=Gossypium arboreum TaxID=29729 RepID=A0ABR0MWX4_GOSAR|nr:hypothetical protein PVK06_045541 [Gossypium arboreum]
MTTGHVFDVPYFIALACPNETEHRKKGPIFLCPYVTRLARHFSLLDTPEQSSTLTLPNSQHDPEDFTDDVPPYHKDPPQPPPSSHRYAPSAASSLGVSFEEFASFRQYYAQRFDGINATLQQICQYLYIAPPTPPTRDTDQSDDEDH